MPRKISACSGTSAPISSRNLRWPLDYVLSIGIGLASFVVLFINYWFPPGKIFDEVYFARAAEDYLTRQYIYENTHPPVTKLLITLSTMLFGGMHGGDNSYGWRFLDVVAGAVAIWLLYLLAKRVTQSSLFATYASGLFALDGMHFVQSRIATPESFVVVFALATLYAFLRYWENVQERPETLVSPQRVLHRCVAAALAVVLGVATILARFPHDTLAAKIVGALIAIAGFYLAYRLIIEPRLEATKAHEPGTTSKANDAGMTWLWVFAVSIALLVTSKWYGVMAYGVAFAVVCGVWLARRKDPSHSTRLRPFPVDLVFALVVFVTGAIYFAAYTPQFIGLRDLPNEAPRAYTFSDVVTMQYNAFEYHVHLNDGGRNMHPYASKWWEWPLDLRPILYYANYAGKGATATAAMIYTLPNPLLLWLGLLTVPWVAYLAIKERNKAYGLVVLTYLAQWLPWMFSPRIAFAYHFYVDIPLIALCNAIAAQRLWQFAQARGKDGWLVRGIIGSYFAAVLIAFIYFYPILAGVAIPKSAWLARLWLPTWM